MVPHPFLVIDDNPDARFLLTKTLLRKFPKSVIQECEDSEVALAIAAKREVRLIVVHRLWDTDGATLIRRLREVNPEVPIIAVSGIDRSQEAVAAGANRFMLYDEWLRIGTLATEVLGFADSTPPFSGMVDLPGGVSATPFAGGRRN